MVAAVADSAAATARVALWLGQGGGVLDPEGNHQGELHRGRGADQIGEAISRAAQGIGVLLWFLMMISGAGPPPEALGPVLRHVGDLTPLAPLRVAIQDSWLGRGVNWPNLLVLVPDRASGVAKSPVPRDLQPCAVDRFVR